MAGELLIDYVYRDCFDKRRPKPLLRGILQSARRFVLDDSMTGFLIELVFESFQGRTIKYFGKGKKSERLIHKLLDDIRHFSRLPHRVTWVEYFNMAKLRQFQIIQDRIGYPIYDRVLADIGGVAGAIAKEKILQGRTGWLIQQHDKIETAFRATAFGGSPNVLLVTRLAGYDAVWDVETEAVPWPLTGETSEQMTNTKNWVRNGVGETRSMFGGGGPHHFPELRIVWTFLSTINKIPLVGETNIERSKGFVARGSYRRFLDYKILKLNVPQRADTRKLAQRVLGDIIRRRAHQVRGHFRDDWHLPKGNKAIWIGEHQRGDASLGFVTHDYSVTHEE